MPEPGDVHAGEGPVLTVRNPQADDTEVMRLAAEIGRTRERIAQLKSHLAELRETSKRWRKRAEIYASVFRDELEVELSGLVDVPVAESTLPLYRVGMAGRVHVDGLEGPVAGTVVYARGAAGALEIVDLAAVSESSGESSAQVIVALEAKNPGARDCLVGRSAYVEFPKVSPLEQLRAFARL